MKYKNGSKLKAKRISRRKAVLKIGKYAAVTALGTFLILHPQKAQATSPAPPGGGF